MVSMEILKEVTIWNASKQSNHTYLVNKKNQIIAYAKWHNGDIQLLKSKPTLDKRYRKFEKSNHKELIAIAKQFGEELEYNSEPIKPSNNIRVFEVKSKDKTYKVTFSKISKQLTCDCVGFGYRRYCKHSQAVAKSIGV
jgi:hypothetical protein